VSLRNSNKAQAIHKQYTTALSSMAHVSSALLFVSAYIMWSHELAKDKVNIMATYSLFERNCHKQVHKGIVLLYKHNLLRQTDTQRVCICSQYPERIITMGFRSVISISLSNIFTISIMLINFYLCRPTDAHSLTDCVSEHRQKLTDAKKNSCRPKGTPLM
jgi:hypothetical protein